MSNPSKPSQSSPLPGDDRNVVAAGSAGTELSFEEQVQAFWTRNRKFIIFLIVLGVLAILGREGVRYMWAARERGVSAAYAECDTSDKLKAFAEAHPKHVLAGFALLRVADESYKAGNYLDAAASYERAEASLKDTPMVTRARIGAAISEVLGGDRAKGEAALKALADDMTIMAGQRMEARFHLATAAIGDGRLDDARTALDDIVSTDITGNWAQRAFQLRASLPAGAPAAATAGIPAAAPAAAGDSPEIKLNIPGASGSNP